MPDILSVLAVIQSSAPDSLRAREVEPGVIEIPGHPDFLRIELSDGAYGKKQVKRICCMGETGERRDDGCLVVSGEVYFLLGHILYGNIMDNVRPQERKDSCNSVLVRMDTLILMALFNCFPAQELSTNIRLEKDDGHPVLVFPKIELDAGNLAEVRGYCSMRRGLSTIAERKDKAVFYPFPEPDNVYFALAE